MATQIQLTRSGTPGAQPIATEMELGELALNYADGKLYFKNDSNNIEQLNSTYNNSGQKIFVNEADNHIGLNTISPEFLLDLGGSSANTDNTLRLNQNDDGTAIRIGGSAGGDITLLRVDNADGETTDDVAGLSFPTTAEGFRIKYLGSNNHELGIFADNSGAEVQALTVLQDGNIGIGETTPAEILHIGGTARTNQLLIGDEWDTGTPNGGQRLYIKRLQAHSLYDPFGSGSDVDGNDNYILNKSRFPLIISVNDDETDGPNSHGIVLYNANGGQGTFSPSILFASRESDGDDHRSAAAGIYSRSPLGAGGASGESTYNDGELIFATSGTLNGSTDNSQGLSQRMVIDRAGKVGINTTTPTEVLDVNGNTAVTGTIASTGNISSGGDISATDITASGDITATGNVTAADPTEDTHLTTKSYVDSHPLTEAPGQVIEMLSSFCNGSTLTGRPKSDGSSRTFTWPNVTAGENMTTTYKVYGSEISYQPPANWNTIVFKYNCTTSDQSSHALFHVKAYIETGTGTNQFTEVTGFRSTGGYKDNSGRNTFQFNIQNNATALANGQLLASDWTGERKLKLMFRTYSGGNLTAIHLTDHWDGGGTNEFSQPLLEVVAIA